MKKLLMIVTLPPPMHGSNRINQLVVGNPELQEQFDIRVLRLNYVGTIAEIGKFNVQKYLRFLVYLFRLLGLLLSFRPAGAYFVPCVSGAPFFRDCAFVLLLRLFRVKIVFHLHAKGVAERLKNPCYRLMYRWFFRDTWVIALSPALYGDVKALVPEQRVRYLPNGADSQPDQNKTFPAHGKVCFLFLSNLVVTKGPLTLLDACYILKQQGFNFTTLFVGNPTKELDGARFAEKIKHYGLEDRVAYLGPKYDSDKQDILRACQVMVFPTYKDCFPLVLLEAMAFAMPVISTCEGAIPEIIDDGQTGLLVPDRDSSALAAAMAFFIEQPSLVEVFGRKGQEKFTANYTLKGFQKNTARIFADIFLDGSEQGTSFHGESS